MVFTWKHNAKCEQPELLCFVDTETYEAPHPTDHRCTQLRFRLGVARFGKWDGSDFNGVQTLRFTHINDFWKTLGEHTRGKRVQWVFAHNALFDGWILGLPEMLDNGQFKLSEFPSGNQRKSQRNPSLRKAFRGQFTADKGCTLIKGFLQGKRINLVDTFNYFRSSVAAIGDSLAIPKLPMPLCDENQEEWFRYCEQDVHIIETAMLGLMREWKANDLGNWQPTIASLAYSSYRHRFMSRPIVCHGDQDVSKIEHDAYYDGRTTVFFNGDVGNGYSLFDGSGTHNPGKTRPRIDGPCHQVDVNSLYPSVMLGNDYPVEAVSNGNGRPIIWRPPSLEWLREQFEEYLCVAICQIDTDNDVFPVRTSHGTIYPVGKIWTTLCTPEIQLALDTGSLRSVMGCVLYHRWPIFNSWVNYWWERKQLAENECNLVRREVCKILLNSLAGKLAQRERYWINTNRWPAEKSWYAWPVVDTKPPFIKSCRSIGKQTQVLHDDSYAPHALVAAAAHVNSYARVRMINDRKSLPVRSVLYAANDGLILTQSGYDSIRLAGRCDTGNLGDYRTVGVYECASIYGPRDYTIDNEIKKAGLPKDREQISNRKWKVKRFESHNAMIARPPDGSIHLHEETVSGTEHHWGQYDPGDGWLRPNLVDMWSE